MNPTPPTFFSKNTTVRTWFTCATFQTGDISAEHFRKRWSWCILNNWKQARAGQKVLKFICSSITKSWWNYLFCVFYMLVDIKRLKISKFCWKWQSFKGAPKIFIDYCILQFKEYRLANSNVNTYYGLNY